MNAREFKQATGCDPEQDDLERANCHKRGEPGHSGCGVCEHGKPVFMCHECFVKSAQDMPIRYSA